MRCAACGLIARLRAVRPCGHAQRIEAPVLMKIANIQRRDFRAAKSHLQSNRQNGAVAQDRQACRRRRVEKIPGLRFRERGGAALDAIDRRPLNIDDGIAATTPCRTRCLNRLDSAARRRRMVEDSRLPVRAASAPTR